MSVQPETPAAALRGPHPPPPAPPELPEGVERQPHWPWWYSIAGFGAALGATIVLGAVIGLLAALVVGDLDDADTAVTVGGAAVQYVAFTAAALGFAYLTLRPRAWHFGFRRTPFWPALGWSALAFVTFFVIQGVYGYLLGIDEEQTTLDDLGVEDSTLALVVGAVLVITVAPVVEEFFFRGFFYRSLRNSLPIWAAALITGGLFGVIHVFSGAVAVPPLIVFGIVLCLLYERTGSLYPSIALHAFNNMLAFMVGTEEYALSLALGASMVAATMLAPRFAWRSAPAAR